MAMVILFGLLTSTALNMVVVPAVYHAVAARSPSGSAEAKQDDELTRL
jgi:Cu/Ag efflux pump CusA